MTPIKTKIQKWVREFIGTEKYRRPMKLNTVMASRTLTKADVHYAGFSVKEKEDAIAYELAQEIAFHLLKNQMFDIQHTQIENGTLITLKLHITDEQFTY